jgi:site-specific DNA-methyltransferase (cytosine-N4-specific)
LGEIYLGDSLKLFREKIEDHSVDLIMTNPRFGLVRKKDHGNVNAHNYVAWFKPFGEAFRKALKPHGSLVIDIWWRLDFGPTDAKSLPTELLIVRTEVL